ncbi:MAG: SLC13 family permease [Armatimonadota bacterium]|nr:SLC13 family permease [Armatimonadota bacterium]
MRPSMVVLSEGAAEFVVFVVLVAALVGFLVGHWRYDLVALLALLTLTLVGIVPAGQAFGGFGHPAVVTVAAVLILSRGLMHSGAVGAIAGGILRIGNRPLVHLAGVTVLVAFLSAFMNNVGALALLMPVAVRLARQAGAPPSMFLMPLAFGSLLGGMTTLIGTPPNIIIATFRADVAGRPFGMFDFTPVGAGVALAGIAFVVLVGWRLIPQRKGQVAANEFHVRDYVAELRVPEGSNMTGHSVGDLESIDELEVDVLEIVRGGRRIPTPRRTEPLQSGDVLVVRADSNDLEGLLHRAQLELAESKPVGEAGQPSSDPMELMEAVVMPRSKLEGATARSLNLRWRYGVNLLAVARQGAEVRQRLKSLRLRAGDVMLLQGTADGLAGVVADLGCLPLAQRGVRFGPRRMLLSVAVFGGAIAAAATGLLPVQVAVVAGAAAFVLLGIVKLQEAYDSIDWSVIVLLATMIPVGQALEATGGAERIAGWILGAAEQMPGPVTLVIVLVGTMFLSDLVNNAAAAVLMAPIAIRTAQGIGASADPFLMAVAVGASCAFLTPIGHQSNTLVMGPGGYRFGDYWRMGLPLEGIIVAVGIPLVLWVWPL